MRDKENKRSIGGLGMRRTRKGKRSITGATIRVIGRLCLNAQGAIHIVRQLRGGHKRTLIRNTEQGRRSHRAQVAAQYAVKAGTLTKQPCEVCGSPDSEAHRPDYARPLEVRWLCAAHHGQERIRIRKVDHS
jgi:hypothetical protein